MEPLLLPQSITSQVISTNRANVIIEPCYPGYGTTLGNALRRVLLSSLPGAAVVAVKITGVDHEFSTLAGVKEDVVDILLNIKQLRLKLHGNAEVTFKLNVTGEKIVTAADIEENSDVEVLNKDLVIASLTDKKANLEIEFIAKQGRGYDPVENRDGEKYDIGVIAIDANYTSVQRVGYTVENVRVGQMTNFDKLTLDIQTDGGLLPEQAVQEASKILINHFEVIAGNKPTEVETEEEVAVNKVEEEVVAEVEKTTKKRGRPKKEA
ncbi:DNA-directed RNA polymerase subunit alpha [Patescibacteria group bacterium]|nr:DNA-directed RNA polymerase subunit alpha [Patescibacteria group bacterium]